MAGRAWQCGPRRRGWRGLARAGRGWAGPEGPICAGAGGGAAAGGGAQSPAWGRGLHQSRWAGRVAMGVAGRSLTHPAAGALGPRAERGGPVAAQSLARRWSLCRTATLAEAER